MNLNGWDCVYVADTHVLNTALAASTARLIQHFSFREQGFSVDGRFGAWSIQPSGSGELLNLQIALSAGALTAPGAAAVDIAGMRVTVQVALQFLPSPGTPGGQDLRFDFRQVGSPGAGQPGTVAPVSVDGAGRLTPLMASALGQAVASCLVQNADQIAFVLATVEPPPSSGTRWLAPVSSAYVYAQPLGGAAGQLAILSVTTPRETAGLTRHLDPGLLAGGGNMGLAISGALFMRHVFVPALAASLATTADRFRVDASGVVGAMMQIALPKVDKAGQTYVPVISALSASVADSRISLSCSGSCDMHMGVSMRFSVHSVLKVGVDLAQRRLEFALDGDPVFHKDVHIPWYDHLLDVFGGVAEIVLQACVTAVSSGLGKRIAQIAGDAQLVQQAPSLVNWAGGDAFALTQGGLAGAFYLRGTTA